MNKIKTKVLISILTVAVMLLIPLVAMASEIEYVNTGQNLGTSVGGAALGDFDSDGDLDLFVNHLNNLPNKVWLNDGSGNFSDSGQNLGSSYSVGIALGDLDGDNDLDAFVSNILIASANKIWLNDGSGNFSDSGQSLGSSFSTGIALGDLDGDTDMDAFVINSLANKIWLNDGSGNFSDSGQSLGNYAGYDVELGDLDGDGDLDAFVANVQNDPNKVWLNDGNGNFSDSGQNLGNLVSTGVALGDLDGDGDLDAFVSNANNIANKVWLNDGSGNFSDSGQSLGNSDSGGVSVEDLDNDGDLDGIVVNSPGVNEVWLNDGSGNFSVGSQNLGGTTLTVLGYVAIGNLDNNGSLDVVIPNEPDTPSIWLAAPDCDSFGDADNDGIGDACDPDTIFGTISGDVQEGISIDISVYTCGVGELITTITTNAEGYYAFGGLENGKYGIYPQHANYIFSRPAIVLDIPQTEIQSYDFTATKLTCDDVDRFLDNNDGTVTDCQTDLVWIKDAGCGEILTSNSIGIYELEDGMCNLTDGSQPGEWTEASTASLIGLSEGYPEEGNHDVYFSNYSDEGYDFVEGACIWTPENYEGFGGLYVCFDSYIRMPEGTQVVGQAFPQGFDFGTYWPVKRN